MNILIAIPCYGGNVSNMTFHSVLNTLRWLNDQGHNIRVETLPTESLINRARNKFVDVNKAKSEGEVLPQAKA